MPEAYIVDSRRTAIGRAFKGSLVAQRPDDLLTSVASALLAGSPSLDPGAVDEILVGCGMPAGEQGGNIARVVAVMLGQDSVPGVTVNRYCTSSMQTTRMAHQAIANGDGDVYLSLGVESVSRLAQRAPDPTEDEKNSLFTGLRHSVPWTDPRGRGDLPDVFISMGETAENVADLTGVTREEMDEVALRSHELAIKAQLAGFWDDEIVPVALEDGTVFDSDESPRQQTTVEKLAELKPVFREGGRVTAGNSCPMSDGAAGLLIASDRAVVEHGLTPRARIVSTGVFANSPEIMGLATIGAARVALDRAGLTVDDMDVVEINEAFAAMLIPTYKELGVPLEKVNPFGGAIALGHPYGMSGARIAGTLVRGLDQRQGRFGLQTMCVAGGQGMAMVIELVR